MRDLGTKNPDFSTDYTGDFKDPGKKQRLQSLAMGTHHIKQIQANGGTSRYDPYSIALEVSNK